MILAFPAWRLGYFKVTGPVIDAALKRGHDVRLDWHPEGKPGERVEPAALERQWPTARPYNRADNADIVIGPMMETHSVDDRLRVISLDYSWEQANAPVRRDLMQCYVTDYQRQMAGGCGPVIGSTQLAAWDAATPLPPFATCSRPMLLVFSCKFRVGGWRRWVYRWVGYRRLLVRLRAWCDHEGYALVVKTRDKNCDPRYVARCADQVYSDEWLYPSTALRLMRSATVAVHFQSNAALELAHAGIPQYSVRLPQPHLSEYRTTREVYSGAAFTLGRWPGVIRLLGDGVTPDPYPLDAEQLRRYRVRYLGEPGASERVLDLIESAPHRARASASQ